MKLTSGSRFFKCHHYIESIDLLRHIDGLQKPMDRLENEFKKLDDILKGRRAYVAGGPVRDLLLGRELYDLDLVLYDSPGATSRLFVEAIKGTLVILDETNAIYRVVSPSGFYYDFSALRGEKNSIEEDLSLRDFTINAMAIPLESFLKMDLSSVIDPLDGQRDLESKKIRMCSPHSFEDDPLRVLRAFRFSAELDFTIEEETQRYLIKCQAQKGFKNVAGERIDYEFSRILQTPSSWTTIEKMGRLGTLIELFPEFENAVGVDQPGFHHLDVFWHLIETLKMMERIIDAPWDFFSQSEPVKGYVTESHRRIIALKWAALLHDIGKPLVKGWKGERVTFYNHDKKGGDTVRSIARRYRWPKWREELVEKLVSHHMRPFHLLNDLRRGGPSKRAMRRLIKDLGEDFVGLFILSMADTLAGAGPLKPKDLEKEVSTLFDKVYRFYIEILTPLEKETRLLSGRDVMDILGIPEGPMVGKALEALEEARVEGVISTREEAETYLREWFATSCR